MARPAVLIVEPDGERRQGLGQGLAEAGWEVVPAASAEEGRRFARGLDPAVIVAPAELPSFGAGSVLEAFSAPTDGMPRTLVLLTSGGKDGEMEAGESSETIRRLPIDGLGIEEIVRRLGVLLLGREIGVEADFGLGALVGDLALVPLLELLRSLSRAGFSGRVVFERGALFFDRGEPIAARCGRAKGIKALGRLARLGEEPFRVFPGPPAIDREITEDFQSLTLRVIEDSMGESPEPRTRFSTRVGPELFKGGFDELQQQILAVARDGVEMGELLDLLEAADGTIVEALLELESRDVVERAEAPMAVRVVTDSTCDLPPALVRENGISVVPLTVHFGDKVFRDRVDLQPGEFYRLLAEGGEHPSSNPPRVKTFARGYGELAEGGDLVSLHISAELSKTVEAAREAAGVELGKLGSRPGGEAPRIEVIDSRSVGLGLGMLALFASRMAARGLGAAEIARHIRAMVPRVGLLFVVDTLDYLARGGRIGRAKALVGNLLGIKPILGVEEGEVVQVDKVRGGRGAHARIAELMAERVEASRPVAVGIAHAAAPVWADRLRQLLEERFEISEHFLGEIGPVVGTHVGPGAVGAIFFQPEGEEAELIAPL